MGGKYLGVVRFFVDCIYGVSYQASFMLIVAIEVIAIWVVGVLRKWQCCVKMKNLQSISGLLSHICLMLKVIV